LAEKRLNSHIVGCYITVANI